MSIPTFEQTSSNFAESFVVVTLFLEDCSDSETKFLDGGTIRHIKACFHNMTLRDRTPPMHPGMESAPPPGILARKGRVRKDSGKERTQANEFRVNDLAISLIQSGMSMSATRRRP